MNRSCGFTPSEAVYIPKLVNMCLAEIGERQTVYGQIGMYGSGAYNSAIFTRSLQWTDQEYKAMLFAIAKAIGPGHSVRCRHCVTGAKYARHGSACARMPVIEALRTASCTGLDDV